ncbi:MAG: hypothetical protein OXB88_09515 [Bacteriovoracales bacterium]|nr:hypothetical protein [Bacteriovoracales bacterium]
MKAIKTILLFTFFLVSSWALAASTVTIDDLVGDSYVLSLGNPVHHVEIKLRYDILRSDGLTRATGQVYIEGDFEGTIVCETKTQVVRKKKVYSLRMEKGKNCRSEDFDTMGLEAIKIKDIGDLILGHKDQVETSISSKNEEVPVTVERLREKK